jgi:hypothetical protein
VLSETNSARVPSRRDVAHAARAALLGVRARGRAARGSPPSQAAPFPTRPCPESPWSPPGRAHAMDHAVPAGAHRGPPVRRRHAAVRAPVEVVVLRRHLRRPLPSPSVETPYKCPTLSPPPAAIAPPPRHPRRRRWAAPLSVSHSQAIAHTPPIDPLEPSSATCCSGRARVVAGAAPPRPPPLVSAVRPRRHDLRPNTGHSQALGEPTDVPRRFPGRERDRLAGIWLAPPPPMAKGRIASPQLVLGCFPWTRGVFVRFWIFLGVPVQMSISNSKQIWLEFVKFLENRRKFIKLQTQFS